MIYDRLDKRCKAQVLAVTDTVLIKAFWPAAKRDEQWFKVSGGLAFNTLNVSKAYFERRYGVAL